MAVSVAQVLKMDVLGKCRILAGAQHLDRPVEHINVLEVYLEDDEQPDLSNHLFLTTFAFAGNDSARQSTMVELLARLGCAAILFQEGVVAPLAEAVIASAERHGMPLIEVPGTVYYHQIIEPLASALLHDQSYFLQHALAVHRRLAEASLAAADLPGVLACIEALLGRPVSVVGRLEGRLGTSSDWGSGATPSPEHLVDTAGLARVEGGWAVPLRGFDWLLVAQRSPDDKLSPIDHVTLDEVVDAVALEVYRGRAVDQAGRRQREELLEALLSTSDAPSLQALTARMTKAGWVLGASPRVVRLALQATDDVTPADDGSSDGRERAIRTVVDALALMHPKSPVALFRGDAAWLPGDFGEVVGADARLRARLADVLERACDAGEHWRWRVGVGDPTRIGDTPNLAESLSQADKALAMSASLPELGQVVTWQQVAMPALLLELSARGDVRRWQSRMLGDLLHVAAERADLIKTLDVFLDTGNSHKQTSRVLGIHPKTLKYRVERIEAILGAEVWHAEQRLSLHLAVKLARLNKSVT